jgi:hypothetical protein
VGAAEAYRLMELLGLSEDELCQILDVQPLEVLSDQIDHRPEPPILLDLLAEAVERTGPGVLARWVRARGPRGRPIELLLARDFAGFEDAVTGLAERGFVLGGPRLDS